MTYGIVYATRSKILRRIIAPDDPADLDEHPVGLGETMLIVQNDRVHQHDDWVEQVRMATGVTPPDATCLIMDRAGGVIGAVMADPDLDEHPLGKLVLLADNKPV